MEERKTKIELTEEETEVFKWCWEKYNLWKEAMKLRPGSLILHFDCGNKIRKKEFHTYENYKNS